MNAYWVAGAAAVGLAVLVGVLARRSRRGPGPGRPPRGGARPARGGAAGRPAPREIWWAEVPFEDGPGAKDRPCLVLRVNGRTATVAKITSKHHAERPGVLALPPDTVGDARGRTSWLETDEQREVPLAAFRRRVGPLDERTWARARRGG
ncbi:type II toxin-antitoxin system PemK/MazF family toxin [Kitasatospora indigofera]|uniref:type II toxin-antitoxin system PemK/MazF family toxin n=1 Tax=Kitasatospora indigofera TaxID=67307 RepID=UPI00167EBA32|nr:type II toxin-antitoxin system PemK/MazF family toxin [Kitasatospora indigofera]